MGNDSLGPGTKASVSAACTQAEGDDVAGTLAAAHTALAPPGPTMVDGSTSGAPPLRGGLAAAAAQLLTRGAPRPVSSVCWPPELLLMLPLLLVLLLVRPSSGAVPPAGADVDSCGGTVLLPPE